MSGFLLFMVMFFVAMMGGSASVLTEKRTEDEQSLGFFAFLFFSAGPIAVTFNGKFWLPFAVLLTADAVITILYLRLRRRGTKEKRLRKNQQSWQADYLYLTQAKVISRSQFKAYLRGENLAPDATDAELDAIFDTAKTEYSAVPGYPYDPAMERYAKNGLPTDRSKGCYSRYTFVP